jgi:ubiquitin carboxyl-terminal hydrolase 9/13
MNFPSQDYILSLKAPNGDNQTTATERPFVPRSTSTTPWPNATSPARKEPPAPGSPQAQGKPEETKDSPEYRKRMALKAGPVLEMRYDNSNRYGMDESLFTALKDIFDEIKTSQSRYGVVSPHKFLEILRRENEMFRSAMHQDAHEFLNLLLNNVVDNVETFAKQHPELNGVPANGAAPEARKGLGTDESMALTKRESTTHGLDTHWVHDLFEGLLTSETRCLTCENTSQRDEPFLDLSVDLSAHTSVTSCLRKFSEEEMLCERNKFHCDNCGGLQEAEKRMKIKRLPRVLALHLKRFKYTEDLQRLQKLFHRVVYPFYLRLFNTTDDAEDQDRLYELYAVVIHIGGGPYHGHYVSIIKTQDRGWLLFDDELVEPVDKNYVLNFFGGEPIPGLQDAKQLACAYVLFYQETTLEAMLSEQESEGQQPDAVPRASRASAEAAAVAPEGLSPTKSVPMQSPNIASPIDESVDGMENLAHAATAPDFIAGAKTPLQPSQTTPAASPLLSSKSRKEKKAEKEQRKAAEKAEQKALEEKRRQASQRRVEMWRKQDDELKAAMAASMETATEEASKRGEELSPAVIAAAAAAAKKEEKKDGLSRFRNSSMSLRGKPKFLGGGSKEKDASERERLASVPQEGGSSESAIVEGTGAPAVGGAAEERARKNRFSLGRKKSQALS